MTLNFAVIISLDHPIPTPRKVILNVVTTDTPGSSVLPLPPIPSPPKHTHKSSKNVAYMYSLGLRGVLPYKNDTCAGEIF